MSAFRERPPVPGPIRTFEFPRVERNQFRNGITLLSARRGDLPLVTVRAVIDAGSAAERSGEEGLAWLTANALETGTARRTGEELAWALERLGAQLDTWTTWDALNLELNTRADRLPDALRMMAEIVRAPSFPEREVERLREEQLAEILRRSTEPRALADDAAARYIFSQDSTYSRPLLGVERRVRTFDAEDAVAYHGRRFTPVSTALVVVGAVSAVEAEREVARAFSDWSGAGEAAPATASTPRNDRTTIYLVDRPSAVQSELRIGHVGVPRHHDDYYGLLVLNTLLGGAFTSRLNLSLREKHGFTYGVRSAFAFRRAAGPFVIQTAVGSDVTARAVEETLREIRELLENGVTEDEVRNARDFLAGTLPLQMQTTQHLAARIADLHTFDLPMNYFEHYREQIGGITQDDVVRVARAHLRPDRLAIIVVGNAAALEADLRALNVGEIVRQYAAEESATAPS